MLCHDLLLVSTALLIACRSPVRSQPYFNSPPPNRIFYQQWGHYQSYDPKDARNRPLQSDRNRPFDYYPGVTPDINRRRLIEDAGDLRCKEAVIQGWVASSSWFGPVLTIGLQVWRNGLLSIRCTAMLLEGLSTYATVRESHSASVLFPHSIKFPDLQRDITL